MSTNSGSIPSPRAFELLKVKMLKNGGIDVIYTLEESDGTTIDTNEIHAKMTKNVHPDLKRRISELTPCLARVYGYSFMRTVVDTEEFGATDAQKELAEIATKAAYQKIECTGFALSGKDDKVGIVLTGRFTADNNMVMAMNSHRMKFNSNTYGFESEMEDIATAIEEEVYAYIYLGKRDQLQAFDASGAPAPHALSDKDRAAGEKDEPDMFEEAEIENEE